MTDTTDTTSMMRDVIALCRQIPTGRDDDRESVALTLSRMNRDELQTALLLTLTFADVKRVDQLEQDLNDRKATA